MFEPKVDLTRLEESVKRAEKASMQKGLIAFYGDSGFTRWAPRFNGNPRLEEVLVHKDGSQAAVNIAFGTSTAEELLYFYERLVKPREPSVLVLQAFGNDYGAGYTPLEIFFLQTRIIDYARHDFPGIKFFLCNIRPTLKMKDSPLSKRTARAEFNELVADYCVRHEDTTLVDQFNCPVFYEEGFVCDPDHVRADMFIEDEVHYNPLGYTIYGEFFKEILKDLL